MASSCCATVALNRRSTSLLALRAFRSSSCSPWAWTLFWDSFDSVFIFIFDFDFWSLILFPILHPTNKFDNQSTRTPHVGETPAVHAPSPRLHWGKQSQLRASQVYRSQDTAAPKSPKVYRHVLHLKSRLKGWKTVSTSRTSIYDLETVLLVVHPLHRTIFFSDNTLSCWKYVYDHQHVLPPVFRNSGSIFEVFYCLCHFWPNLNLGCHVISQTARALVWPRRSTKRATSWNKSISSPWHKQKRVHLVLIMAVTQNIGYNTPASHLLQSCLVRSVCILHFVSMGSLQQSLPQTLHLLEQLLRSRFSNCRYFSEIYI